MPDSPSELEAVEPAQSQIVPCPAPAPADDSCSVIVTQVPTAQGHAGPAPFPKVDDLCEELRPEQVKAMYHILAGLSIADAAIASGVGCRTLYRWCKEDEAFAAALNTWRHAQLESSRTQALTLITPALQTVGSAIKKGHVSAALQVIRGLGVLSPPKPGETDPDRLKRKRKIRKHRKQQRLEQLEQKYHVPDDNPIETVAEWDNRLDKLLELRDDLIRGNEKEWRNYELTLHLTPEQCEQRNLKKPAGPPTCPRPSESESIAALERECRRRHWHVGSFVDTYIEERRKAAEAAKGPPAQQPA